LNNIKHLYIIAIFLSILLFSNSTQYADSSDISWKENIEISSNDLLDVTWGNNCFVAVGLNGIIMRSSNGRNWTKIKIPSTGNIKHIIWFNDRFVSATDTGEILNCIIP